MIFLSDSISYTPEEVAHILKISKYTVYEMIKRGDLNAYRIGRKVRVESTDLNNYIQSSKQGASVPNSSPSTLQNASISNPTNGQIQEEGLIICGQDVVLDILTRHLGRQFPQIHFLRNYVGSMDGLNALYRGQANVITTHLWDSDTNEYNIPFVRRFLPGRPASVINLVYRFEGFYVVKGNPKSIYTWSDLTKADVRFVNRESGSGARVLIDEQMRLNGIRPQDVLGYYDEEMTHVAVASRVAREEADVGLGIEKAAMQVNGIDFIPLQKERYDLVILKNDLVKPQFQALLSLLNSSAFRREVMGIGGYDITDMGRVMGEV